MNLSILDQKYYREAPPNSVAESIDFEQRIVAWYDKHLKPKTTTTTTQQ